MNYGKTGYVFKNNNKNNFIKNFENLLKQNNINKEKIKKNYKKTNFFTRKYFISEINKILN